MGVTPTLVTNLGSSPSVGDVTAYSFSENPPLTTNRTVRFQFTDLYLEGANFINLSALATGSNVLGGTLTSLSINVTVTNTEPDPGNGEFTYASDLTVLVATVASNAPNVFNGGSTPNLLLQGGGTTGFETGVTPPTIVVQRRLWYPSGDSNEEVAANTSYSDFTQIVLAGTPGSSGTDPVIWLGHGFTTGVGANYGTWTGYVDFTFASSGGSGVPDASRTALLLAPGTLLLLGLAGRSRRRS